MIIHLDDINELESRSYEGEIPPEKLELDDDKDIKPLSGLKYSLKVQNLSKELLVTGKISLDIGSQCVRCGENFEQTVEIDNFCRSFEIKELKKEELDLTFELREDIILAFSLYPVCSEGCKGVCPICGKNLNREDCECPVESDDRWSGLDNLDIK